jgi:hypothetical protein
MSHSFSTRAGAKESQAGECAGEVALEVGDPACLVLCGLLC